MMDAEFFDNSHLPEMRVWRAVVLQVLIDLSTQAPKGERQSWKIQARTWVDESNKDFLTVCDLASVAPSEVIAAAEKALNGFSWRAPAGKGKRYEIKRAERLRRKENQNPQPLPYLEPHAYH